MHTAPSPASVEQIFQFTRSSAPDAALRGLCHYVTGVSGYLVVNGFAIHGDLSCHPLVPLSRRDASVGSIGSEQDEGLAQFDLSYSRITPAPSIEDHPAKLTLAALALRLGLLAKALDVGFQHLEHRHAFGQKLLHHQLVKARFSMASSVITRLRAELRLAEERQCHYGAAKAHELLSQQFTQAAKLMGGHGYLVGGIHTYEYIAALVQAVYASQNLTESDVRQRPKHTVGNPRDAILRIG